MTDQKKECPLARLRAVKARRDAARVALDAADVEIQTLEKTLEETVQSAKKRRWGLMGEWRELDAEFRKVSEEI